MNTMTVRELIEKLSPFKDHTFYVCVDTDGETGHVVIEGANLYSIDVPGVS